MILLMNAPGMGLPASHTVKTPQLDQIFSLTPASSQICPFLLKTAHPPTTFKKKIFRVTISGAPRPSFSNGSPLEWSPLVTMGPPIQSRFSPLTSFGSTSLPALYLPAQLSMIPPTPSDLDESVVDVCAINQDHLSRRLPGLVLAIMCRVAGIWESRKPSVRVRPIWQQSFGPEHDPRGSQESRGSDTAPSIGRWSPPWSRLTTPQNELPDLALVPMSAAHTGLR